MQYVWELAGIGRRLVVRVLVIPFVQLGFKFFRQKGVIISGLHTAVNTLESNVPNDKFIIIREAVDELDLTNHSALYTRRREDAS